MLITTTTPTRTKMEIFQGVAGEGHTRQGMRRGWVPLRPTHRWGLGLDMAHSISCPCCGPSVVETS